MQLKSSSFPLPASECLMRFVNCLTMTYKDTVWNTSVLGFWHSNFYYILLQSCGSKKKSKNVHSMDACSYLQKVNNAVNCISLLRCCVPQQLLSGGLAILCTIQAQNLWLNYIPQDPLQPPLHLNGRSIPRITISSHSRFLRLPWKEKAIHPRKRHSFSPCMVSSVPQLCFSKNQVTLLLALYYCIGKLLRRHDHTSPKSSGWLFPLVIWASPSRTGQWLCVPDQGAAKTTKNLEG